MRGQSRSERSVAPGRGREVAGIVMLGLSLFVGLSVVSLQLGSGTLMGPCGATVGLGVYALVGVGAYLAAFGLGFAALRCSACACALRNAVISVSVALKLPASFCASDCSLAIDSSR